eukprot:3348289-Rhodomonas_salina.1
MFRHNRGERLPVFCGFKKPLSLFCHSFLCWPKKILTNAKSKDGFELPLLLSSGNTSAKETFPVVFRNQPPRSNPKVQILYCAGAWYKCNGIR